jgi:hypothetical protein
MQNWQPFGRLRSGLESQQQGAHVARSEAHAPTLGAGEERILFVLLIDKRQEQISQLCVPEMPEGVAAPVAHQLKGG